MKVLYIGDVHAEVKTLGDCSRLIDFIEQQAISYSPDMICFLGDLFHNHSVVHLSVLEFWHKSLNRLSKSAKDIVCLVGNHDRSVNSKESAHSMILFDNKQYKIVEDYWTKNNVLFVGYKFNSEEFYYICNNIFDCKTVVCHQTFDGARYENGFYAKDGWDLSKIPQKEVISGHIHLKSTFSKVKYPGAPRSITLSDKNEDKYIHIAEHAPSGAIISFEPILVDVCSKIIEFNYNEENKEVPVFKNTDKVFVNLSGTAKFIEENREKLLTLGIKVKTQLENRTLVQVKESDGITSSFVNFVTGFSSKNGTSNEVLAQMASGRIKWTMS